MEANLLQATLVATQSVHLLLGLHIHDACRLIARSSCQHVVVRAESDVHDGIPMNFELDVRFAKLGVGRTINHTNAAFFVGKGNERVGVAARSAKGSAVPLNE